MQAPRQSNLTMWCQLLSIATASILVVQMVQYGDTKLMEALYGGDFNWFLSSFVPLIMVCGLALLYAVIVELLGVKNVKTNLQLSMIQCVALLFLIRMQRLDTNLYFNTDKHYALYAALVQFVMLTVHLLLSLLIITKQRTGTQMRLHIIRLAPLLPIVTGCVQLLFVSLLPVWARYGAIALAAVVWKFRFLVWKLGTRCYQWVTRFPNLIFFLAGTLSRLPFALVVAKKAGFVGIDGIFYHLEAKSVLRGHLPGGMWAPGFILFLSGIYLFGGESFPLVAIIQCLISGAIVAVLYQIANKSFDPKVAILASVMAIADGRLLFYSHYYGPENLLAWTTTSLLFILLCTSQRRVFLVLISVIAVMLKPIMLPFVGLLLIVDAIGRGYGRILRSCLTLGMIVLSLWIWHGLYILRDSPHNLLGQHAEGDFFIAWNPHSSGKFGPMTLTNRLALADAGYEGNPYESENSFYTRSNSLRAFQDILANPIHGIRLTGIKIQELYLGRPDYHTEFDPVFLAVRSPLFLLGQLSFCILAAIGGASIIANSKRRLTGMLLGSVIYFTLLHITTWAKARYRVPLEPILILLAAKGVRVLWCHVVSLYQSCILNQPGQI